MENSHQIQTPLVQENTVYRSEKKNSLLPLMSVIILTAVIAGAIGYYLGSMQKSQTMLLDQEVQSVEVDQTVSLHSVH